MYKNYKKKMVYPARYQKKRPHNFRGQFRGLKFRNGSSWWHLEKLTNISSFNTYFPWCSNWYVKTSRPKHECLLSDTPADIVSLHVALECQVCISNFEILAQFNVWICPETCLQWQGERLHVSGMQWIWKSKIIKKFGS